VFAALGYVGVIKVYVGSAFIATVIMWIKAFPFCAVVEVVAPFL
jgi:hypothetical protein